MHREFEFKMWLKGVLPPREPTFIDKRVEQVFEESRDALQALHELERVANEILGIKGKVLGYGGPRYAIVLPDSLQTIPQVALVVNCRKESDEALGAYGCSVDAFADYSFYTKKKQDATILYLGNEATLTIPTIRNY